jgi:hypothetical protein
MPRPRNALQLHPAPEGATSQQAIDHYRREIQRLERIDISAFNHQLARGRHFMNTQGNPHARDDLYLQSRATRTRIQELMNEAEASIEYWEYRQHGESTEDEQGGGLASDILHGGRRTAPPRVRKLLAENQDAKIVKLEAGIVPVQKPLTSFLNWISGGRFEKKREQLGYNDVNHAYLIVTLDNGHSYRLEKNHVVEMFDYNPVHDKNKRFDLHLSSEPALSTFLSNGERYQESTKAAKKRGNFWQYDPQNNNCQYFVDDLVQGNSEITNKQEANQFFFQPNAGDLINETGLYKPHVKYIVPLATIADRVIHGEGLKKQEHIRQLLHDRYHPYH